MLSWQTLAHSSVKQRPEEERQEKAGKEQETLHHHDVHRPVPFAPAMRRTQTAVQPSLLLPSDHSLLRFSPQSAVEGLLQRLLRRQP